MTETSGFEDYVHAKQEVLLRAAYLLTGDAHLAQDLVQTALERIWARWERVSRVENLDGYVYRVLFRLHVGARRRRWSGEVPTPLVGEHRQAESDAHEDAVDRLTLLAMLARLPRRQRAVVVLRFYLDLSEAQAAEALGCRVGTVKSQSARALASLRRILPDEFQRGTMSKEAR
jgi:RNA polymerase sigma-70 factor (sigma-E family)